MIKIQKKIIRAALAVVCVAGISILGFFVVRAEGMHQKGNPAAAAKDTIQHIGTQGSGLAAMLIRSVGGQPAEAGTAVSRIMAVETAAIETVAEVAVSEMAVTETASTETAVTETTAADLKIVTTAYGKVRGKKTKRAYLWLGVPYGQTKRWQAPKAPKAWNRIKSCKKTKKGKGDNCLFVNVYKPLKKLKESERLPVMVFLHGGGNVGGTPNRSFSKFVQETGVIVVSVEFRQGAFGWFSSRGLPTGDKRTKGGNFAMLDIKLALEWVKNNIDAFGGDKGNVTLSGFSAGARDALNCIISPIMKGLFHKAVSFSGGMTTCSIKEGRKWSNEKLAQVLVRRGRFSKKKNALKYVRRLSRKKLNRLLGSLTDSEINRMADSTGLRLTNFPQCFRDGVVIPKSGFECVEWGGYNRVPMLIGSNNSEFANVSYNAMNRIWENSRKTFKNKSQFYRLLKKVKKYGSELQSSFYLEKLASKFSVDPYHCNLYSYRFSWGESTSVVDANYVKYVGAIHGMDVDFILGRYVKGDDVTSKSIYTKANRKGRRALTSTMRQYIKNFLYTGNPNGTDAQGQSLPKWNKWGKAGSKRIMTFSATKTKAKAVMTSRYIDRAKCKKKMRRNLTKKTYQLFKKRILNDRFFM